MQKTTSDETTDRTLKRLLSLHPKLVDLSLGRMQRLLRALGNPEHSLPPVVHVTGTNGKGSVLAFLRAILEAAGHRVHVYTSPHLVRFNERIRLDGAIIDEPFLQDVLAECEAANGGEEITFFEITTAAAFVAFSRTPADFVLLENGLGGRLDATNVVARPAATGITPVSMDHQQFLGDRLEKIAAEKAGIIKAGVPCVVGPQMPEAGAVIAAKAKAENAPLLEWGRDWTAVEADGGVRVEVGEKSFSLPAPSLAGPHQVINMGHAVVLADALCGADLSTSTYAKGVTGAEWPGRLQQLRRGPVFDALPPDTEVWLDGGHNPDAAQKVAAHAENAWADRPLMLIVGMIESKDPAGFFAAMRTVSEHAWCVTIPGEQAAIPADDLARVANAAGFSAEPVSDVVTAGKHVAKANHGHGPFRVLICGSLYFAGHILGQHA